MHKIILVLTILTLISCQKREETTTISSTDTSTVSEVSDDPTTDNPIVSEAGKTDNTSGPDTSDQNSQKPITGNIVVQSPQQNDYVNAERFLIKGQARTFENTVVYRVTDLASGQVIASGFTTAQGEMGQFSPFTITAMASGNNKIQYPTRALIEVFEHSAKDGSEINMVKVQVRMGMGIEKPNAVQVFFSNTRRGSAADCDLVFSVPRSMPQSQSPAKLALSMLLAGPTGSELTQGYQTHIPEGTKLNSITIQSGTARVDFSSPPNAIAGSCKAQAVRAQIERTLKQFSTVQNVVITVNGKSDQWQP